MRLGAAARQTRLHVGPTIRLHTDWIRGC